MNLRVIVYMLISFVLTIGASEAKTPAANPKSTDDEQHTHRSLSAIRTDVLAALRAEAVARRTSGNTPEVLGLIELYHEMATHPQRETSVTLKQIGQQVRSRLEKVREHIELQNSNRDRLAKRQSMPNRVSPETRVLAQQLAPPGGAAVGQGLGPARIPAAARTPNDYGPDLVELIQQTISPATWDINGGNGAIVYYAPLRALVVRAPAEIHEQIGGLLGQLRAAP